jgi:hypothetical protein
MAAEPRRNPNKRERHVRTAAELRRLIAIEQGRSSDSDLHPAAHRNRFPPGPMLWWSIDPHRPGKLMVVGAFENPLFPGLLFFSKIPEVNTDAYRSDIDAAHAEYQRVEAAHGRARYQLGRQRRSSTGRPRKRSSDAVSA